MRPTQLFPGYGNRLFGIGQVGAGDSYCGGVRCGFLGGLLWRKVVALLERAREVIESGDTSWEQFALELSRDLDIAKAQIEELTAENQNLHANQNVLFTSFSEQTEETREEQVAGAREPANVVGAVALAIRDCRHLYFLDSCAASARDSPFRRAAEIYEALSIMNKVADVWARNQGGGDLREMLRSEGLGKRVSNFVSQTSKGKWGDEYMFEYDGERRLFEWHITLGAGAADTCLSIHFFPDPIKGQLVIGHVGRHLTNTRS